MRTLPLAMCLAFLLLSIWPGPAAAQESLNDMARAHFKQGHVLYRQGKFKEALVQFQQAAKYVKKPSISLNMAQCHRNLDRPEKALFFYKLYLNEWRRTYPGKPVRYLSEVKGHIGKLAELIKARRARPKVVPPPPPGKLRVVGINMPRVQVLVDDAPRAVTPVKWPIKVKAGEHEVRVEVPGYVTFRRKVKVAAGEEKEVWVNLIPVGQRSKLWLAATITTAALAAGGGAVGLYYNLEANTHNKDSKPYFEDRTPAIAGYVVGGTMLALSVTSLVLYLTSGATAEEEPNKDPPAPTAALFPIQGGAAASLG